MPEKTQLSISDPKSQVVSSALEEDGVEAKGIKTPNDLVPWFVTI
jgi:hypothetical protein